MGSQLAPDLEYRCSGTLSGALSASVGHAPIKSKALDCLAGWCS